MASWSRAMTADEAPGEVGAARTLLDRALLGLRRVEDPRIATRDVKAAIADALEELYRAEMRRESWQEFHGHVTNALRCVRESLGLLQETPTDDLAVHECLELCASVLPRLLDAKLPSPTDERPVPQPTGDLVAMEGEPVLVRIPRQAVRPEVPLPPLEELAPEVPKLAAVFAAGVDVDELLALAEASVGVVGGGEDDEGDDEDDDDDVIDVRVEKPEAPNDAEAALESIYGTAITSGELLRWRAEQLIIDLASLGRMRFPQRDLPWTHGDVSERRLLTRLDALYACGAEVLPHLVSLLEDRPMPDPELTWALVMVFGCIDGRDALDEIARLLEVVALDDPEVAGAVADALVLAPHPGIGGLLAPWRTHRRVERRRIATHVLGHRRELALDDAIAATTDDDRDIALHGARALMLYERPVPGSAFREVLRHRAPAVVRAGILAALAHRRQSGFNRALELCLANLPAQSDAAMFVAVAGAREDGERLLLDLARTGSEPLVLRALGWHGSIEAVGILLDKLDSELEAEVFAAAEALERITGAFLLADGPIPDPLPNEEPFKRGWSPLLMPPEPCLDRKRWSEWWARFRKPAQANVRYRGGHAWSPRDDMHMLEDEASTLDDRIYAWIELSVRTGASIPLDWHRFLSHQRILLDRWRAHVSRGRVPDGGWPVRYEG
ncbi:MAG: hypothetical protein IT379_13220 [Deltaproteobacteria bacterium]|nr:hypothetical protein [Deltaproteobacteria bacterium]